MASSPPLKNDGGWQGGGQSDETSKIFCGNVNFPKMNRAISVHGGRQSQIIIKSGLVITNNTLLK